MGDKKQRIIPAHYSWNSSIFTRGIVDPIKRKLGWVDENERPVSLKESATGQEWDRVKDTAKGTGKLVATGLAFSNPVTASATMAPLITGSQAYFMTEGLKDAYDRITSPNKTAADGAMVALDIAGAVPAFSAIRNGAKYVLPTAAKTVAPALIAKQISKTKLPTVEPTLNIGWGPKQTLKVFRAGEYDQMYFPERWDAVNEGANPHGVWLQGKYGTPRTDLTNPGKGAKAARARNVFSTRPDKYTGTVTLDKPMITVGEVPNRSLLSYQADNIGADGLIYNGVYDNGYNNNQVILSFRRPKLTKIQLSEAERLGIPKGDRGNLSQDQLDALEDLTSYMQSGRYKNKFVIDQAGNFAWKSNLGPEDTLVPRAFADANGDFWPGWANVSTKEGTFKYITDRDHGAPINGGFTAAFPKPDGMKWGPGELASRPESKHSINVIMTSPKVDAIDSGLEDPIVQSLSNTIDPGIVKNWWIRTKQMSHPGSYLSGDAGKFPIGFKLLQDVDNHKFGNIANDLLYPDITNVIGRQGLSPDSYASIVKQGLRDGNSLRFGEPFFKWNPSAVKNKYIYDASIQYKNGEISIDQYKETVDNWLKSIGVNKQSFIKDGKLMIPHPFVYYNKQGGILKRVESGKSGIHIKPENRGKFTALKKRTGKSSTWYKEHGTPAQKKMAVFALNARKWKHK